MPNAPLASLQKECEDCLAEIGFAPEGRAYKPHLTLGRVNDPRAGQQIVEAVEKLRSEVSGVLGQTAREVVLFESILRPQGSQYVVAHKVLLRRE